MERKKNPVRLIHSGSPPPPGSHPGGNDVVGQGQVTDRVSLQQDDLPFKRGSADGNGNDI